MEQAVFEGFCLIQTAKIVRVLQVFVGRKMKNKTKDEVKDERKAEGPFARRIKLSQ